MNIPFGTQFIAGKELDEEVVKDLISFMDSGKTGYFCITSEGEYGVEDGLLVVESGTVIGSHYAYLGLGKEYTAGEGLKRVLNALLSHAGVYDAFTISAQQLELFKIFNESLLLLEHIPLRSLEGMIPVSYSAQYAQQEAVVEPTTPEDILKTRGITEINIDNYTQIKGDIEALQPKIGSSAEVADEIESYLKGEPRAKPVVPVPTKPPAVAEAPMESERTRLPVAEVREELEELDAQAEKLKKLLLKED